MYKIKVLIKKTLLCVIEKISSIRRILIYYKILVVSSIESVTQKEVDKVELVFKTTLAPPSSYNYQITRYKVSMSTDGFVNDNVLWPGKLLLLFNLFKTI